MWSVPTRVVLAADGSSSSSNSSNSFHKDGRKISLGDCALFKPPRDSPPFIGVIRSVTAGKENKLKLGVNWLYRPAEVKLGKGVPLDAAPNELFYSFHKDEIPAASLLHPCKVAFLPKGAELPSGISSFVCRRLYDVKNKRLWWLNDKDYINERQEEVDQLLSKTQVEMHATVQSGGRSPKPTNGPTSTSQLKAGSDNVQTSVVSFSSSQVKGKKRERSDQGAEPFKRERITKTDDSDSGHLLKSEIAKITDKGGLVNLEGVERLVQLMLPDRTEKKIDLARRSMLAGVIAATENFDCLEQFVQLRGLPVFDEWLQEVHKGKVGGDNSGPKDSDKSVEEFLIVLLRALDKLPVNLHALQMCNIGKSVNLLRSHKNSEIQKKSRSLVDTWKKRVEAEMNINDTKGVGWPGRSRSEVGNRISGGSSDVAAKSSKSASVKIVQGDSMTRSASVSPGSIKSASMKDGPQPRNTGSGMSDVPLTPARDEKSSGSSQSHNNSQSCSNDAGSMNANKVSGGGGSSSRPRKSANNGFQGSSQALSQRKIPAREKSSQSGLTNEKVILIDGTAGEGNSHGKLIVKIPNRGGRSPAQNSGGSFEDPALIMSSRASSPALSKDKNDLPNLTPDVNAESWQSNDFKDVLTASDEGGDGSPAEERCYRTSDDGTKKVVPVPKTASSSTGNEQKSGNFSSMRALIASCVQHSEVNGSISAVDDVGMNLLASVAAGEMTDLQVRDVATNLGPSIDGADVEHGKGSDDKSVIVSEEKPIIENTAIVISSVTDSMKAEPCEISKGIANEGVSVASVKTEGGKPVQEKFAATGKLNSDAGFEANHNRALETESKVKCGKNEGTNTVKLSDEKPIASVTRSEPLNVCSEDLLLPSESNKKLHEVNSETVDTKLVANESEEQSTEPDSSAPSTPEHRGVEQRNSEAKETENCGEPDSLKLSSSPHEVRDTELVKSKCSQEEAEEECTSTSAADDSSSKLEFDLNEGFNCDDGGKYTEPKNSSSLISPLPFPASVTVAAAAKGPFLPPNNLLRSRGELGWKGSAATSAFRPAEPRKVQRRPLFDFDLNVAEEMVLEDTVSRNEPSPATSVAPERSSGGLDLDLNEAGDDASDMGSCLATTTTSAGRDFDLNDDPAAAHFIQQARISAPGLIRTSHVEPGSFSSPWFHPGPTYPAVATSVPQRMVGPTISGNPFGPVLSASPAIPFPPNSFQYPVFSYPTTTTTYLDSSSGGRLCFPGVQLGPAGGVSSNYSRPYVISIQDGGGGGGAGGGNKRARQGLDLNAGPAAPEIEGREEHSPLFQRQMSKRKEPDGGWDGYKQQRQPSLQ